MERVCNAQLDDATGRGAEILRKSSLRYLREEELKISAGSGPVTFNDWILTVSNQDWGAK
jgi:hypothetical protein